MKHESKQKTLIYCRAEMLKSKPTLQAALAKAFKAKAMARERFEMLGGDAEEQRVVRFINDHPEWRGMRFGALLMYTPGRNQHVMDIAKDAESLPVAQLAPPADEAGQRQEFLDSILYFGVLDDHLIVCQSQSLKAPTLDDHLNWLLRESRAVSTDNGLNLCRELSVDLKKRAKRTPVKRVTIGRMMVDDYEELDEGTARKRRRLRPVGVGPDILRRLLSENIFEGSGIDLESLAGEDDLRLEVSLSYRGRHRDALDNAMRSIVGAAKFVDEQDIKVEFEDGKGKDGKLFVGERRSIRHVNGLVDPEDMWSKMHEQLRDWLDNDQV